MSVKQLRLDVENLYGSKLHIKYVDDDNTYGLTMDRPAMVTKEEKIYILDTLPDEFRKQAEAHELAHLYLKYAGLIQIDYPFDYGFPVSEDFLALEINNAISHFPLIQLLHHRYGITSELHLNLRATSLEYYPQQILDLRLNNDTICLHGIGIALFDMDRTLPHFSSLIHEIAAMDPSVCKAFQQSMSILQNITLELNPNEQMECLQAFIRSLSYSINLFKFKSIKNT